MSSALVHLLRQCPTITTLEIISSDAGLGEMDIIPSLIQAHHACDDSLMPSLQTLALERVHIDIDGLCYLIELCRAYPKFRCVRLHNCAGDLSSDEMLAILKEEFQTAEWFLSASPEDWQPGFPGA